MVRADSEGRFTIPSVVPGEYKVFVFDEIAYGAAVNPHFISRFESSGVPVTVKGGETVSVDPQIIPVP
jgi:3D (Asp-Asp-Asp) domain-containing protein